MARLFMICGRHCAGEGLAPARPRPTRRPPFSENKDRRHRAGLSLVELLIVMAVIGLLSGLAVPLMFRMGLFAGNRVELATREMFSALRAAKIYAATHNVDAGLAYAGRFDDPDGPNPLTKDSFTGQNHPVVDAYVTVRRLKREELRAANFPEDAEVYVPVGAEDGSFTNLPRQTCLLPDVFQISGGQSPVSATGLRRIAIVQSTNHSECLEPRPGLGYMLGSRPEVCVDDVTNLSFPAHIFRPSGELRADDRFPQQRLSIRVGLLPNEDPEDRFTVDPTTVPNVPQFNQSSLKTPIPLIFADDDNNPSTLPVPQLYTLIRHPDPSLSETDFIDNDRQITLYRSQGRIKIEP